MSDDELDMQRFIEQNNHHINLELEVESDDEDVEMGGVGRERGEGAWRQQRVHLHQFLRLMAGGPERHATSNEELVANLRRMAVIQTERVAGALRICARDAFLPADYREEAFLDVPVRLEDADFNVSAPHMHATCLEALDLQPGHCFLDIGSGSGLLTACGALLVGKAGRAVGVDVRRSAVSLARENVTALAAASPEYAGCAGPVRFDLHNVFMPSARHRGAYDRVHCGAACPPERLGALIALLRPEGGLLVTPVAPSDLRAISLAPDGAVQHRILSQVRYSDLEVPSDVEVLLATLRLERRARIAPPRPPSTFAADVSAITGSPGSSGGSSASDQSAWSGEGDEGRRARPGWPKRVAKFLSACSGSSPRAARTAAGFDADGFASPRGSPAPRPPALDVTELGPPDAALVGAGWRLPAHTAVLRTRCDHLRARADSGMRDAAAVEVSVPEHFPKAAGEVLLAHLYSDGLDPRTDADTAAAALHLALYFGTPRLAALCELLLARLVRSGDASDEGVHEAAAQLLGLADEAGLAHLRAVALDWAVHHLPAVVATRAWAALPRRCADAVALEAAALYARATTLMASTAAGGAIPGAGEPGGGGRNGGQGR